MKKILALILTACMVLCLLAGCGQSPVLSAVLANEGTAPAESIFTPGAYTATGYGKVGPVVVEVSFSETEILSVVVTEHNETVGIGDNAVNKLPELIVKKQTLDVDTVAGATLTSGAILSAVSDCVCQAGADPEALVGIGDEAPVELKDETLEAELVIVGGGGSGMTAAIRAHELGIDVILVEKMPFIGGAISISGGNQVVMGSQLQIDCGVSDDSVESMVEDFMKNGNDLNVPELVTLYAENIGATTDWLQSIGVTYNTEGGLHNLAEYAHNRELAYTGGGSGAAAAMRNIIAENGTQVLLETRATELIVSEGAVVGVIAESADTRYTINAKSVLLSTGGYGWNKELLTEEMQNALFYGPVSSTGDGIIMATAIGADTRLMEYGKRYPNGIEVSEGIAKSTIDGNIKAWTMSAILVNAKGERVVNEKASNHDILEVELAQPEQMLYLLLDKETYAAWHDKLRDAGYSEADFTKYLEANGSSCPIFYNANSLEELEALAGIEAGTLTATVERYNSFVEAGVDEDFGRLPEYMTMKIGAGPYFLIEQQPRFATTMGGLVVNTGLQVLDTDGNPIEGLYASGETVGGVMGTDSPSGANNGWAVTSGRLAVESIASK